MTNCLNLLIFQERRVGERQAGWPNDFVKKMAQNVAQHVFCYDGYTSFAAEKGASNFRLLL
jgi:hypothetical protein